MLSTKTLTVALVALLATGGAAATVGTVSTAQAAGNAHVQDAEIDATMTNETVTVSVDDGGTPVANATVYANDAVGATDEDGTVTFERGSLTDENESFDELEIAVETAGLEAELEYQVENDSLVLLEESYEYDRETSEDDAEEGDDEDADDDGDEADDGRFEQAPPEHAMGDQGPPEHAMNDDAPPEHAMDDEREDGDDDADERDDEEADEDDAEDDETDERDDDAAGDD